MKPLGAVFANDVASAIRGRRDVLIRLAVDNASGCADAGNREELAPGDTHAADFTPESIGLSVRGVSSQSVMSLDPAWLFLSLIPGGIGFVLFVYGKKQQRMPLLIAGLVFMVYPYFTPTTTSLLGVGLLLGAGLWTAVRLGW